MMQDLSMHIMDIAQNSIRAGATEITIKVTEDMDNNFFAFTVIDNGCGIPPKILLEITDPFTTSRTTRSVGLGLPLLNDTCEMCGGFMSIKSTEGEGTLVEANMQYDNIDRPPLGNIADTIHILIVMNPNIDFVYIQTCNKKSFEFNTCEIKKTLDGVPLTEPSVMEWLKEYIIEGINEIV